MRIAAIWGGWYKTSRPVSASVALLVLMIAGQVLVLLGAAAHAQAAPGDRPVDIVIASISPKVGAPGATIEVSGMLINTTDVPITDLAVRLQRGPTLESRTDLANNDSDPVEVNDSSTDFVPLAQPLAGSGVLPFTYTTTPEDLRLSETGAYPLLVNVNGQPRSEPESRVGEQVVLLPYLESPPTAVTQLSWLWPLVAPPERNAAGVFTGTDLASSLGPDGRLGQALSAIEATPNPDGSTSMPTPVTLAVDPALLEGVQILAAGDYQLLVGGQQQTSSVGSADAANWLTRLRALAASLPVVALPYADPDIAALISRGEGRAVERLLPDGRSGDLVEQILGVAPELSIAWPPDGSAGNPAVLDMLAERGVTEVVAAEATTFVDGPGEATLDAVSTVQTRSGPIRALVADHVLSELTQVDVSGPGTQAMTEQRFLAELVVIAAEAPARSHHLLLAPPRDFVPETASALIRATAGQRWLGIEQLTELGSAVETEAARSLLSPAPGTNAIPEAQLAPLISAMRARDDFASALTSPATDLLGIDRALARAATSNRSPNSGLGQAAVQDVLFAVAGLSATVGIVPPASGTYSLASADAPLVLTVRNDNPFTVEVTIRLAPRGAPGVTTTNVVRVLPAQARTTIQVPANVQRSGVFTVIASASTPEGTPLGAPVQLRVQSTVYGPVAIAITFGAGALLALLFARRSVKYWRGRRSLSTGLGAGLDDGSKTNAGTSTDEQLVEPPRRSPV